MPIAFTIGFRFAGSFLAHGRLRLSRGLQHQETRTTGMVCKLLAQDTLVFVSFQQEARFSLAQSGIISAVAGWT